MASRRNFLNNDHLLFRLCSLWCQDPEQKDKELAKILGISPKNFSDLLQRAKQRRLISRVFNPPAQLSLQESLTKQVAGFGVRHVSVVEGGLEGVGHCAARFFESQSEHGDGIVLDGGRTIGAFVSAVRSHCCDRMEITPIAADPPCYAHSAFEMSLRMANKCPSGVRIHRLPSWTDGKLRKVLALAQKKASQARFVFLGTGPSQRGYTASDFVEHLGLDPNLIVRRYTSAIAAIGYCHVAEDGKAIRVREIDKRMPRALEMPGLKNRAASRKCHVVLLAAGTDKAIAARSALRAKCVNAVIVDDKLGSALGKLL